MTDNLIKFAKFILQNNSFKCNGEVKQRTSATALVTKFAPPYGCTFMDQVKSAFVKIHEHQALAWFRYIADIFSSGTIANRN